MNVSRLLRKKCVLCSSFSHHHILRALIQNIFAVLLSHMRLVCTQISRHSGYLPSKSVILCIHIYICVKCSARSFNDQSNCLLIFFGGDGGNGGDGKQTQEQNRKQKTNNHETKHNLNEYWNWMICPLHSQRTAERKTSETNKTRC